MQEYTIINSLYIYVYIHIKYNIYIVVDALGMYVHETCIYMLFYDSWFMCAHLLDTNFQSGA